MKPPVLLLALLVGASALSACGDSQPSGSGGSLNDIVWQLTGATIDGSVVDPIATAPVTITFHSDGTVGGTAACNSYGGSVSVDGSSLTFPGPLMQTEMACMDAGVMDLESAFLTALTRVTAFTSGAETLVLSGPQVEMRFAPQPPEPDAALIGPTWNLETLVTGEAASTPVSPATLVFTDDGRVAGSGGCNSIGGSYDAAAGFGQMISTKMGCEQPVMDQEFFVLSILTAEATVTIDGSLMTIADLSGNALIYRTG